MFYFKFIADTAYCGTKCIEYMAFEERPPEIELDDIAEEIAINNAESFEYLVTGWDDDEFDNDEDRAAALEDYYNDVSGCWIEISKEEFEENS
jgi:hypothetical protein